VLSVIIKLTMKYIFIINLFEDINGDTIFYKYSQTYDCLFFLKKRDFNSFSEIFIFLEGGCNINN